jgi:hypothetical protein
MFKVSPINAAKVASTLTDYVAYVDLARLGITTLAEAESVRVYLDRDKTIEIAREIVSETEMWVRIPTLAVTTKLYVDWDGVRSNYLATDTYGAQAVWGSNAKLVAHTSGSANDSSGNANVPTIEGATLTTDRFGRTDRAYYFDGTGARILYSKDADATTLFTIKGWFLGENIGETTAVGFVRSANGQFLYPRVYASRSDPNISRPAIQYRIDGGTRDTGSGGASPNLANDTWYFFAGVIDANSYARFFIDDYLYAQRSESGGTIEGGNSTFWLGGQVDIAAQNFKGKLSDISLWDTTFATEYLLTEYNNQSDEADFWGEWLAINDVTVSGGVTIADEAMVFDGTKYIVVPGEDFPLQVIDANNFEPLLNIHTVIRMNPNGTFAQITRKGTGTTNHGFYFRKTNTNRIQFGVRVRNLDLSAAVWLEPISGIFDTEQDVDVFVRVYQVSNQIHAQLYINNVLVSTASGTSSPTNGYGIVRTTQELTIGGRVEDQYWDSRIYGIRFFNRNLTTEERTATFNAGKKALSPVRDGLIGEWSGRYYEGTPEAPTKILDTASWTFIPATDERAVELHGIDTTEDTRTAELRGSETATDERDIELHGKQRTTDRDLFPDVRDSAISEKNVAGTTHTITLPTSVAGDLLLLYLRMGGGDTSHTLPDGWNVLENYHYNGRTHILWRRATGTEGASVNVTTFGSRKSIAIVQSIQHASDPEAEITDGRFTTSPPPLTPSWGTQNALWFAWTATNPTNNDFTAPPAGYEAMQTAVTEVSTSTNDVRMALAQRKLLASTEDPGEFTSSGSKNGWHLATVAVYRARDDELSAQLHGSQRHPGPAAAPFPQVAGTATSSRGTLSTSHNISLPAGIQAGDLVLVQVATTMPVDPVSGWEKTEAAGNSSYLTVLKRIADGSEGTTLTVTTLISSSHFASTAYRITDHTQMAVSVAVNSLNPPAVNAPSATNALWLTVAMTRRGNNSLTIPEHYTDPIGAVSSNGNNSLAAVRLMTGRRELDAATEDPDSFTSSGSIDSPNAVTIAISGVAPEDRQAQLSGIDTVTSTRTVEVIGYDVAGDVRMLELTGYATLEGSRSVELTGMRRVRKNITMLNTNKTITVIQ